MDRFRRAGQALLLVLVVASFALVRPAASAWLPRADLAAAVAWPTSTLVVSEVQTGGTSASDEFAEISNAGAVAVDLTGLEVVYATSTGSTVTRKASWSSATIVEPGRHLLIANSAGIFAALADAVYSGGFAATGGAIVLRPIGGTPIDAVGWGDATNTFVEGTAAPAPASGSSIERLPGGDLGNGADTNVNVADFAVRSVPTPQNLAAPATPPSPGPSATPVPSPSAVPSPSSTPTPTPTPIPSAPPTPVPTISPTPVPTPSPTPSPSPSATATPMPTPVPTPTPSAPPTPTPTPTPIPTPTPTPTQTPTPTPTPTPTATPVPSPTSPPPPTPTPTPPPTPTPSPILSIADARALPDGSLATVRGILTTALGAIDSGRNGFIQDATAGIAIRLDAAFPTPIEAGTTVEVTGSLSSYFSLRVIAVSGADVIADGADALPAPLPATTGEASEAFEGTRLLVSGTVTAAPSPLSDGLGVTIDDGSGPLRLVVSDSALAGAAPATGDVVTAIGPLGQRDSSGTGLAGYRLHATLSGEFAIEAPPTPSPTPVATPSPTPSPPASPGPSSAPTPSPSATPTPTPTPAPSVTPSPSPSASPAPASSIADARRAPVGTTVSISGVVIAEAGRLGTPPLLAIADTTGGIAIRLPEDVAAPPRGSRVTVSGKLADPYGQLEIRPAASGFQVTGSGALPLPRDVDAASLGEDTEGLLVRVTGVVDAKPTKSTSGDVTFFVRGASGSVRVVADASSGIAATSVVAGATYDVTGVAGQRASRKGELDGYRVWTRDTRDLVRHSGPGGSPAPSPSGGGGTPQPTASPAPGVITIAEAVRRGSGDVTIEGVVIAPADLLDATGRRIVVEDRSAGVELLIPADSAAPAVGARIRASGQIGRAYDAPRLRAATIVTLAVGGHVQPMTLTAPPTAAHEWRLVTVAGTVSDVHKLGDRWRAELTVGQATVVINGLAGARIAATAITEGRRATIVGIVRRPYPGASDRRWSVVPRGPSDVEMSGAAASGGGPGEPGTTGGATAAAAGDNPGAGSAGAAAPDVDLAALAEHVGQTVRVGGLVQELASDGFVLDDGTATGRIVLTGDAAEYIGLVDPGDAVNATGRVELDGNTPRVVVTDAAGLARVGDLTAADERSAGDGHAPITGHDENAPAPSRLAGGLLGPLEPGAAGVAGIGLLSGLSLALTVLRRRRARRLLAARVGARLAGLAGAAVGPPAA
jgi:uncharacterized protein YdeI (BOF family)